MGSGFRRWLSSQEGPYCEKEAQMAYSAAKVCSEFTASDFDRSLHQPLFGILMRMLTHSTAGEPADDTKKQ